MEDRYSPRNKPMDGFDLEFLGRVPFFKDLKEDYLREFLREALVITYDAAQTIFHRGDISNSFFVLLSGRVSVGVGRTHDFIPVQTLSPGNILGWSWIVPPHRWRFDAIALERSRMLMLEGSRIRDLCERDHDFGYEIMKRISMLLSGRLESSSFSQCEAISSRHARAQPFWSQVRG